MDEDGVWLARAEPVPLPRPPPSELGCCIMGSRKVKADPRDSWDSTQMSPPWALTSSYLFTGCGGWRESQTLGFGLGILGQPRSRSHMWGFTSYCDFEWRIGCCKDMQLQ